MCKSYRFFTVSVVVLAVLFASAGQPVVAQPAAQQGQEAVMRVIDQFLEAYRTYDMDTMLSLHTDDAVWTWIDPGKNLPLFGPEGKWVGTGKNEIRAMFELDRGTYGFSGYILWSDVNGHTVKATELWENDYSHQIDVPLITQSTYKLRQGKIAEWTWIVSPVSSWRFMNPGNAAVPRYKPPAVLVHGAQIRSPNGIKVGPDGNLYVASVNEQAILVINPQTGKILKRLGPEVGVDGPDDLAFGPDGSIYWTDFFRGSVGRLAPDGKTSSQMVAPGVNPIIFSKEGRLFVALAFLGDAFYELDPNLTAPPRLLAEKLGGLNSFQFGPDGMLYAPVMDKGQVVRIDVNAKPIKVEVVAEGLAGPVAAKLDSQGRLYTVNPPGIVRVDMKTGAIKTFATVPYGIDNFIFDAKDRLFVSLLGEGTIAEVKPNGALRMLGPTGLVMPGGVAVVARPDGESIFVANTWVLHEFDAATGKLRRTVDDVGPNTVAVDGENLVLSSWFGNGVWVWNPQTQKVLEEYYDFNMPLNAVRFQGDLIVAELGTSSVVRASAADPKQRTTLAKGLGVPAGLVASKGELWVSDRATGKVWQLAAGGKVLTEPKLTASGLDRPEGMALTPDGRLLVAETGTGRLVAINLGTGSLHTIAEGLGFNPRAPEGAPPTMLMSSVAVSPSGVLYVTGDLANVVYRIEPGK